MYTLFQYSYIDIGGFDGSKVCGFSFNLGSEWNDLGYCRLRRDGSVFDSCTFPMKRGWYKEFKAILEKHSDIRQVSSWVYKTCEKVSEHRFEIEINGWNREFHLYSLGNQKGYTSKLYKQDEEMALALFGDLQEFLLKQGYKLEYNSLSKLTGNNGNSGNK